MSTFDPVPPTPPSGLPTTIRAFAVRLAIGILLANLIVLGLVILVAGQFRSEREERAKIASQNISQMLVHDIANFFDKIDIVLLTVADEAERQLAHGNIDKHAVNAFMARLHGRIPETDNLLISDAEGSVLFTALPLNNKLNVADRIFFSDLRDNPREGLYISKPVLSRLTGKWLVITARRIHNPNGSFFGVLWGTVTVDYFAKIFAALEIGPSGGISLRDAEMGIMARYPAPKEIGSIIGNKKLSPELRKLFDAGRTEGSFYTPISWDNTAKIVSYRKIGNYPLYINVGLATKDYLAGWQQDTAKIVLLFVFYLLFTVCLSWALFTWYKREKLTEINLYRLNVELEQRVVERTAEIQQKNLELEEALARVKHLEGIIPICMYCKSIRDDQNSWQQLEKYISDHSEAMFSHGICPNCAGKKRWQETAES